MKRLAQVFLAVWAFNFFLWLILQINPAAYIQLRANGAQWFECFDWDADGRLHPSDQCTDTPPVYEPEL